MYYADPFYKLLGAKIQTTYRYSQNIQSNNSWDWDGSLKVRARLPKGQLISPLSRAPSPLLQITGLMVKLNEEYCGDQIFTTNYVSLGKSLNLLVIQFPNL